MKSISNIIHIVLPLLSAASLAGAAACSSTVETTQLLDAGGGEEGGEDAAPDAVEPDAAAEPDAAPELDAASEPDAAAEPDAAVEEPDAAVEEPDAADEPDAAATWPATYPEGPIHSPITPSVAARLGAIAAEGGDLQPDVFMKVGDSMTVDSNALTCFSNGRVDLGAWPELEATRQLFLGGDAAGSDPFARTSEAAEIGRTARWALTPDSSGAAPVEQELAAVAPQLAVIQYGTNDMQQGSTFESALWGFGESAMALVDWHIAQGVIPLLLTIPSRGDRADADAWVPVYNATLRGIAQTRQIPLIDLHAALEGADSGGLAGDGIHLSTWRDGGVSRGCVFTDAGLAAGNNQRNLAILQGLDRVRAAVIEGDQALDPPGAAPVGDGSPRAPVEIQRLPFADQRDTRASIWSGLDRYTGCNSNADESGPEVFYRLTTDTPLRVRALVFARGDADIDLHLLDDTATAEGCVTRAHRTFTATLAPGTWHFVLDTFVSGGQALAGEYLFVLLPCADDDLACE